MELNKAHKIAQQFGYALCEEAVSLCDDGGEGGWTVGEYLNIVDKNGNVNLRRADNIIDAGRAIRVANKNI